MLAEFEQQISQTLEEIKSQGLFKTERIITTPQDAHIVVAGGKRVLNMCANNYLGLADHPALIAAAKEALDTHGFGMASVRFICGTQDIHKKLEAALVPFEQMLAHSEFLLGERPLFVDFDLFGMLENFLYSGHYTLPKSLPNLREWHRCMKTVRLAH